MKLLITGATGQVGGGILEQCIEHPEITSIVAFTRRPIPESFSKNSKVSEHIVNDFATWTPEMLEAAKNADAMIWALGAPNNDVAVNYDYPLAFQEAYLDVLKAIELTTPFRFVLVTGKFAVQNQSASYLILGEARKLKGRAELKALELAKEHQNRWKALIIRPAGVISPKQSARTLLSSVLGTTLTIREDELGIFAADLAVHGHEQQKNVFENQEMVVKARELLKTTK